MTEPRCTIVIRSYNESAGIDALLPALLRQTVDDVQIVLVDSGSTDNTLEIAARYPVEIVCIPSWSFSFGRALNVGCSKARGKILVFASAHVLPMDERWLENLLAPFEDPTVGMCYGKQRVGSVGAFSERQILRHWFPEQSDPDQRHPFCNNANSAVRGELWRKMPFNEELTGLEDIDWAKRMLAEGHKLYYSAEAGVFHGHREHCGQVFNRYRREAMALHAIMGKALSLPESIWLCLLNILNDFESAWHEKQLTARCREIVTFRVMQFVGAYWGYRHKGSVDVQLKRTLYYPSRKANRACPGDAARDADKLLRQGARSDSQCLK